MDIRDVRSRSTDATEQSRQPRSVEPASSARPAAGGSADRVTLSDRAQAFQQARQAALDVPDVRSDRVEALRRQLQSGQLVPDPERIARALLAQGIV